MRRPCVSPSSGFHPEETATVRWQRLGDFVGRVSTGAASGVVGVVEAVRTVFVGDPDLRRKVAFSVAMIALSAKMAKATAW